MKMICLLSLTICANFEQVWALHRFLERNVASFKEALRVYDEKHGTDTFEEEIEDLLSTHTFMDGNWTLCHFPAE